MAGRVSLEPDVAAAKGDACGPCNVDCVKEKDGVLVAGDGKEIAAVEDAPKPDAGPDDEANPVATPEDDPNDPADAPNAPNACVPADIPPKAEPKALLLPRPAVDENEGALKADGALDVFANAGADAVVAPKPEPNKELPEDAEERFDPNAKVAPEEVIDEGVEDGAANDVVPNPAVDEPNEPKAGREDEDCPKEGDPDNPVPNVAVLVPNVAPDAPSAAVGVPNAAADDCPKENAGFVLADEPKLKDMASRLTRRGIDRYPSDLFCRICFAKRAIAFQRTIWK